VAVAAPAPARSTGVRVDGVRGGERRIVNDLLTEHRPRPVGFTIIGLTPWLNDFDA